MSDNMKYVLDENSEFLEHYGKGEAARKALYTARNWVNGKWHYIYGDNAKQHATNAQRNADMYKKTALEKAYAGDKSYSESNKNAEKFQKQADAYKDQYNKSILGRAEKAKKAASNAKNAVGSAISKGRNAIESFYGRKSDKKNAEGYQKVADQFKSDALKKAYNKDANYSKDLERSEQYQSKSDEYRNRYNKSVRGTIERGKNAIVNAINSVRKRRQARKNANA